MFLQKSEYHRKVGMYVKKVVDAQCNNISCLSYKNNRQIRWISEIFTAGGEYGKTATFKKLKSWVSYA